jgi:Flp pilus assembly pilin Flp
MARLAEPARLVHEARGSGRAGAKGGENNMRGLLARLWKDEAGLTTVEYALLLALLVVAAVAVWSLFGTRVRGVVNSSSEAITNLQNP